MIDANTPVSSHQIVVVLQVKVFTGTLVRLANANEPVSGVCCIHLVVTVNQVVTDHNVIIHVIVWLYPVLVSRFICTVSPLFTIHVSPTTFPLIMRYPEVVRGVKLNVTGTVILIIPAVYIFVLYRVFI